MCTLRLSMRQLVLALLTAFAVIACGDESSNSDNEPFYLPPPQMEQATGGEAVGQPASNEASATEANAGPASSDRAANGAAGDTPSPDTAANGAADEPASTNERGPAELFGAALSDDVEFIDLADIVSDPEAFANRPLQTEGIVRGVCQRRGCWMELRTEKDTASENITVKFLDYGFFVPTDSRGAFVRVEGIPEVQVLTAEQVEELLEDGYDPGIVREDGTAVMFRLMASGVMMWDRED